ncbi:MAG TPA: C13 family peptidase [Rhizomicrobium sp.]
MSTNFSGRRTSSSPPPSPETDWQRYGRYLWLGLLLIVLGGGIAAAHSYFFSGGYGSWAAVVVAGDWRAHDGSSSEIFDNARRDVSAALVKIGFKPEHVLQFSVRPERYPGTHPFNSDADSISASLAALAGHERAGCLLYFSSHGAPSGLLLGERILAPSELEGMVTSACGDRPTIVVISACYSGVFVPALQAPNRMIVTAARPDRTSFRCGGTNKYPYFDACFLSSIGAAADFEELAHRTKDCVAQTEQQTGMSPPSDPQIFIGSGIAQHLPAWG